MWLLTVSMRQISFKSIFLVSKFFFHQKKFRLQPKFCLRLLIWIWKKSGLDCFTEVELGIFWKLSGYNSHFWEIHNHIPSKSLQLNLFVFCGRLWSGLMKNQVRIHSWQSYNGHNESLLWEVWKNCHQKMAIFCDFFVQMTPEHDNNAHQTPKTCDFLNDNLVRVRKNLSQILRDFHTRL